MTSRLDALTVRASDPAALARFWADLLGRDAVGPGGTELPPVEDAGVALRFVGGAPPRKGLNQVHLHLTSAAAGDQDRTVQRALDLGARHLDVGQLPDEDHVVLADPEGNEFCVIEAGNSWLAGCGFLGELACDGTPEVGRFHSAALGWPLVWDQDGETAVRSPLGGPKIAWGGPPLNERHGPNRMFLDLSTSDDLAAEVDRLTSLGAALVQHTSAHVVLADPDGNELRLTRS
ncbi:VOC family protein [Nocardioides sp. Soil805]|uniref:VOC family protein n=1 Tax=Nocardioides sp. Soil805 TaxID=1736416 RepID=UPI000702B650|nr:VOC family protein [Nocardioides sp. Soil805]KRF37256.1 bleomycin resistance protein [Nocardioides sp. Soil805]